MPTVFNNLSDGFYTAFFEPNSEKRRIAIDLWIKSAVPVIQSAVENEIRTYLEPLLKDTWTTDGWKSRAKKFSGLYGNKLFIDTYKLCLEAKIKNEETTKNISLVDPLTKETRTNTLCAIQAINPLINPEEKKEKKPVNTKVANRAPQDVDYADDVNGRSPNDDRSDSMNPNNDSYQAAMDNHSNQMNPNNDAYWSSRGR